MLAPDHSNRPDLAARDAVRLAGSARRICLITTEFHGLFKNGGIGTANTGLALALAQAGFDVTVAFANSDEKGPRLTEGNFPELQASYRQLGITLDFVPASQRIARPFEDSRSASYCVYLYLKQHEFDVVYFNDCGGHGYFSLLAKHTGAFPNAPLMYVVAHGPHEWVLEINSLPYRDRWPVVLEYMERRSAVLADALISPSRYLVDWMISHGWDMPAEVMILPNIVNLPRSVAPLARTTQSAPITEIVFFGRMEVRKGLELFCDAVDLLDQSILAKIRITFLGKFSLVAGLHSGMYVVERARSWRSPLRFLTTYAQEEALAYLTRAGVLAVVPSLAENSPCVVAECLELGVPFIATNGGGTPELVAAEDRDGCLIEPDPRKLAAKLERILETGQRSGRPSISSAGTLDKWLRLSRSGVAECRDGSIAGPPAALTDTPGNGAAVPPLVSVCLTPSGWPPVMETLLDSLLQQNYPRLEVILAHDRSGGADGDSLPAAFEPASERIAVRVAAGAFCDRGAARNAAAAEAHGQYLLFVDEHMAIPMPECVDALVAAALRTGADIVTGVPSQFEGSGPRAGQRDGFLGYFPIGACAELGAFENCFGSGVILVSQQAFARSGGFEARCDRAIDEWLYLATSVLSGLHLEVVPEPLFHHKTARPVELNRSNTVDNYRRIVHAYRGQQVQMFKRSLEAMANIDRANQERLQQVLAGVSSDAREIALRVSTSLEPTSPDALRGFVQFCVERHKVEEAFDFALHNGRPLLSDVVGTAKLVAETLALDAVRSYTVDLSHDVGLTADIKQRIQSVSGLPPEELVQPTDGVAQSIQPGITVLKAAAICPPGTRFVRAMASVEVAGPRSMFLAVVASTPEAHVHITEQNLVSDQAFWWSGWVSADKRDSKLELSVPIGEPVERLLDLYFLCKTIGDDASQGTVTWSAVTATISVNGTISSSGMESLEPTKPVPMQLLDQGILLTDHSGFAFPIFVPGNPTLVHPLPGKIALVRIPGAVPPGTKRVRSVVSVDNAEGHPVQFAVWVRSASAPAISEIDFTEADTFSGWFTVRDKFRRHRFTATLRERASEAMDLYLATRVVEFPDVHYCHAVWHELLMLE